MAESGEMTDWTESSSGGRIRQLTKEWDALTELVLGAAIEVHRILGPGYLESFYEEALSVELTLREIKFLRQYPVQISYKNQPVGEARLDFLVEPDLIVELKSVETLAPLHTAQVISYLKATGFKRGLPLNFNVPIRKQGIKRISRTD